MATTYATQKASAVAQVATATFATYDTGTTRTITIGGVAISAADSGGTLTAALSALAVLLNASTHPYFSTITWTSDATKIIGTADTAGVPFVFAGSVNGGTGTVSDAFTITTTSAGASSWDTAGNWSGGATPGSDDIFVRGVSGNIAYNLDQSSVTPSSLNIDQTFTGLLGLPHESFATSLDGETSSTSAVEYRQRYLKSKPTLCNIGLFPGTSPPAGSPRIMLDFNDATTTCNVFNTATNPEDENKKVVRLRFNHASSVLNVYRGSVGVAVDVPGETSTIGTVNVGYTTGQSSDAEVEIGSGVTLTTYTQTGGKNVLRCAATTVNIRGGTLATYGSGAVTTVNQSGTSTQTTNSSTGTITTLNLDGGTWFQNGAATITTANVTGTLDLSKGNGAVTITNLTLYKGAKLIDPNKRATFTNNIILAKGVAPTDVTLDIGTGITLTRS